MFVLEPTKTPDRTLDLVSDADLVVEYIVQWIVDAEDQLRGPSGEAGPHRLRAVAEAVLEHIRFPWTYLFVRRSVATTLVRMVYGTIARKLPPGARSHVQVKI